VRVKGPPVVREKEDPEEKSCAFLFLVGRGGWRSNKGPSQKYAYRHISVASDHGSL